MNNQNQNKWKMPRGELKEQSIELTDGMFLSLRQEENRLRRDELEKHNGAHSRHCAPTSLGQKQGGWYG